MRRLDKKDKKKLIEELKLKFRGKLVKSLAQFAKDHSVTEATIRIYVERAKCEIRIEDLEEDYKSKIRGYTKLTKTQKEQEVLVLEALLHNCLQNGDTTACIAWARATGMIKKAEVDAKSGTDKDKIDWRKAVDELHKRRRQ